MPEIQLPGIRLYYEEHGEGIPILCIHGTSSSAMAWQRSFADLARLGRVIAYDRRGCTRSERPDPYLTSSMSEHADDAAALLSALSATPAIVIGRSYGGEVAVHLALHYPEHVRALVLLEGALSSSVPAARQWTDKMTERLRTVADRDIDAVAEVLIRDVLGGAVWEQFPADVQRMFADNGPAILAEFEGGLPEIDEAMLAGISQPVLLVAGADSPAMFREANAAMAAAVPHASMVLVGGGHMINPSCPEVLEFIEGVIVGSEPAAVQA